MEKILSLEAVFIRIHTKQTLCTVKEVNVCRNDRVLICSRIREVFPSEVKEIAIYSIKWRKVMTTFCFASIFLQVMWLLEEGLRAFFSFSHVSIPNHNLSYFQMMRLAIPSQQSHNGLIQWSEDLAMLCLIIHGWLRNGLLGWSSKVILAVGAATSIRVLPNYLPVVISSYRIFIYFFLQENKAPLE